MNEILWRLWCIKSGRNEDPSGEIVNTQGVLLLAKVTEANKQDGDTCPKCLQENPGNKDICSRCGFPVWN